MNYTVDKKTNMTSSYGNIFDTYSKYQLPNTVDEVFDWGELLWLRCGEYSHAISKTIRYFLTDVSVQGDIDFHTRRKYYDYFMKDMDIIERSFIIGRDLFMYGNVMLSHYDPFSRSLTCNKCKSTFPIKSMEYTFSQHSGFKGSCKVCRAERSFRREDKKQSVDKVDYIRWSPRDIHIEYNEITEDCEYYLRPSERTKQEIKAGSRVYMNNTPWEFIEAVLNDEIIRFDEDQMLHLAYNGVASLKNKLQGWGLPPFMACFDQIIHLNLLKRYNEAILMDYLIPFRFLSPPKGGPENDPLLDIDAGQFTSAVQEMIAQQKNDPTSIHTVPYPVTYQALGGEAKQLAPTDMIVNAINRLLDTMGVPMEFREKTLQSGGPLIGLKMFEREQASFFSQIGNFLDWVADKASTKLIWEKVDVKFKKVSLMEDDLTRQTKLDMLGANKVSNDTALSSFGVDYEYEVDKIIEEQTMFDEKMVERDRKAQKAGEIMAMMDEPLQDPNAQGGPPMEGGMGPGGPPGGGGGAMGAGGAASMDEIHMQADQQAQELLTMEASQRRSTLIQLKKTDETLHALVKEKLKTLEQQAAQQGLNMTRAGQAPPPGMQ